MTSTRRIVVAEESQVGEARRCTIEMCNRLGVDQTFTGKAAIVATEMARNIVRHGGGGEFLIRELPHPQHSSIELLALDNGPGMRNATECLRDGYSTIGTAGTGLGSIKRLSDQFEVYTAQARGTVLWARLCTSETASKEQFDIGGVSVAMPGEEVCGDAWEAIELPGMLRVIVADGLGHGIFAEQAAREAISVFRSHPRLGIPQTMELMHQALTKTRGAAASAVELRATDRQVISSGVGNVSMRLVEHGKAKNLISDNGTLGASVRKMQSFSQPWSPDMLLVMHTDGVGTQWNLDDYPGLFQRHPSLIAGVLYRDFKRTRDDATVIAARYARRS
ncbi:ATP-binding protein [Verrucomicrobiota bacterium sgz303538]